MGKDKETREKLLRCAKQEFIGKGYMKASLRNICKNAGVTTGAMYFFFEDKEALFGALVEGPLNNVHNIMIQHYNSEKEEMSNNVIIKDNHEEDFDAAIMILEYIYQYYDEMLLVLTKSQGTKYEKFLDDVIDITEKHYRFCADQLSALMNVDKVSDDTIHWIAHMQTDVYVYMLTHEKSIESAKEHIRPIITYLITGWFGMFQEMKNK